MLKRLCFLILLSFPINNGLIAQLKYIYILDSLSKENLPVNLNYFHGPLQTQIVNKTGQLSINNILWDSITISSIGYKSIKLNKDQFQDTIFLKPLFINLEELIIFTTLKKEMFLLGDTLGFKNTPIAMIASDGEDEMEWAQAIKLPPNKRFYKFKTVFIPVKKSKCWRPLIIHIYALNALLGIPGDEIFRDTISINREMVKKNLLTVDLTGLNWSITGQNIIFLSCSWVNTPDYENCYTLIPLKKTKFETSFIKGKKLTNSYWNRQVRTLLNGEYLSNATAFSILVDAYN